MMQGILSAQVQESGVAKQQLVLEQLRAFCRLVRAMEEEVRRKCVLLRTAYEGRISWPKQLLEQLRFQRDKLVAFAREYKVDEADITQTQETLTILGA